MGDPADKIRDLCTKVLDCKDPEEFNKASNELREALNDHLQGLRKQVADRAKRKSVSFNG